MDMSEIFFITCQNCGAESACRKISDHIAIGNCETCGSNIETEINNEKNMQWEYIIEGVRIYEKNRFDSGFEFESSESNNS